MIHPLETIESLKIKDFRLILSHAHVIVKEKGIITLTMFLTEIV